MSLPISDVFSLLVSSKLVFSSYFSSLSSGVSSRSSLLSSDVSSRSSLLSSGVSSRLFLLSSSVSSKSSLLSSGVSSKSSLLSSRVSSRSSLSVILDLFWLASSINRLFLLNSLSASLASKILSLADS